MKISHQPMRIITLFLFLVFSVQHIHAQRNCGTMDYLRERMAADPGLEKRMELMNLELAKAEQQTGNKSGRSVIRIPVVVHVVYSNSTENITDAQIQSQIDVLNQDYRKLNSDVSQTPSIYQSLVADCEIEFCLASRDPAGLPTNGITRTQTTASSFGIGDAVKRSTTGGKDAWPTNRYLNIWVCDISNGLLGFATLPGTVVPEVDGVVVSYKYFGTIGTVQSPYNKGRTATHEVGHWLNLLHIWGDDDGQPDPCSGTDQVSDTPNQDGPNFGCPTFPQTSCGNSGDMTMNFMDYTNDACMYMFTEGQKTRMQTAIQQLRPGLLTSSGCQLPLPSDCDTLNNITGGDGLVYYFASEIVPNASGYLTGTNSEGYRAFAERFVSAEPQIINGIRFDFAAAQAQSATEQLAINIWDDNGPNGAPGNVIASTTIPFETIAANVENFLFTDVFFPTPPLVEGTYYAGFNVSPVSTDTIAVYSNQFDEVNINTAWLRTSTNTWLPFNNVPLFESGLSLAIQPVQCIPVSVESITHENDWMVFPNPASDVLQIRGLKSGERWMLISIDGRTIATGTESTLSVAHLAEGLYLLVLQGQNRQQSRRIVLSR